MTRHNILLTPRPVSPAIYSIGITKVIFVEAAH
jgi:hypothetical protein